MDKKIKISTILKISMAWIITLMAGASGLVPRGLPVLISLMAVLTFALFIYEKYKLGYHPAPLLQSISLNRPLLIFGLFCVYLMLNALFISELSGAVGKILYLALLFMSYMILDILLDRMTETEIWRFVRGILIAVLIATLYLVLDFMFGHFITKIYANYTIDHSTKQNIIKTINSDGMIIALRGSIFNIPVCALNIILWPVLLIISLGRPNNSGLYLQYILIAALFFITFMSNSESAKVALIFSSAIYLGFIYKPDIFKKLMLISWASSVILIIPFIVIIYSLGFQNSALLPLSAQHRVHIWQFTADQIPSHPVLGIGIRQSRNISNAHAKEKQDKADMPSSATPMYKKGNNGMHPHNLFLQTWHETGVIGAVFLLLLGIAILQYIQKMPKVIMPYAYATFTSISSVVAFGYGMWQSWLIASIASAIFFLLIAIKYHAVLSKKMAGSVVKN